MITGDAFPAFAGVPVDRIVLYTITNGAWVEIPSQVDERYAENLREHQPVGCRVAWDPCELTWLLAGVEVGDGAGLDDDDEIVFMARDAGSLTASSSFWVGEAGTDTMSVRYKITINDEVNNQVGLVYAYAWLREPDHQQGVADYVTWTPTPDDAGCINAGESDPACGWLRSTDATSLNRFNFFLSGNWSVDALCVKPVATDQDCDSTMNIIDKFKVRAKAIYLEDEKLCDENMCRAFLGAKDGKVRVVRRVLGMCSGRYMTRHEFFYGTWYRQVVNLRAHDLEYFRILNDHLTLDLENPGAEDPAEVFTEKFSVSNAGRAMDKMDFTAASFEANPDDWFQIDSSRGGYIQFGEVTRGLRDVVQSFDYTDSATPDAPEDQPGQYGQCGYKWINTPVTDGDDCNLDPPDVDDPEDSDFNFARIERTMVPLGVDIKDCPPDKPNCEPYYRSDEAERYSNYRDNPFVVGIRSDSYNPANPPGPGRPNPCGPTLEVLLDDGGYSTSASVDLSGCEPGIVGTRLYRGLAPGSYSFLADLGLETTYSDMQIQRDVTYRYVARTYDFDGNLGPESDEAVITVVDTWPPPLVEGITATAGSQRAIISWDTHYERDIDKVFVNMATDSGGPYYRMNPSGASGSQTEVVILNLQPGQTYYFTVTTQDVAGNESEPSIEMSVTPTQ